VGRRDDGYHLLESLVVFATDVGDTVGADRSPRFALDIDGQFAPALSTADPTDNLVVRACEQLVGREQPVAIRLTKRMPIAAGLGGGSADAAATLRLLNRLLGLQRTPHELTTVAASLGADVPMCLQSQPTIVHGIGEDLAPVRLPALPLVLACPPLALRTPDVFHALGDAENTPLPDPARLRDVAGLVAWLRATRNDLSAAAMLVAVGAGAAAALLARDSTCLFARMTGSGPAAFGIFGSRMAAEAAAARLAAAQPSWWVAATMTGAG